MTDDGYANDGPRLHRLGRRAPRRSGRRRRRGRREPRPLRRGPHPRRGQAALEGRPAGPGRARPDRQGDVRAPARRRVGIGNDTTLVLYGDKNNWFAAYAYWYVKTYGHADVRILNGGRQKWIDEGRELDRERTRDSRPTYSASERDESIRAYRDQVREWLGAGRPRARRRPLAGRVRGRPDRPARLRAGGRAARRATSRPPRRSPGRPP